MHEVLVGMLYVMVPFYGVVLVSKLLCDVRG